MVDSLNLGLAAETPTVAPMLVISDSQLVCASPDDETLKLCSPSQLLNTDVAAETLKSLDDHEKSVEAQVRGGKHILCMLFHDCQQSI